MGEPDDRISELPDVILHHILSLMPMKSATGASILSRRWRDHLKCFLAYTKTLDFGEEFASVQTEEEFAASVDRCVQLHKGKKVDTFRIFFDPGKRYQSKAEKWIEFATAKGVIDLDLDFRREFEYDMQLELSGELKPFKLPHFIFSCDSVVHLKLGHCDFNYPSNFHGFGALQILHLQQVYITSEMLESLVSNCLLLEELGIRECFSLRSIVISGSDLRLKILSVVVCYTSEIVISAPNLHSFQFCGDLFFGHSFNNISSLEDVLLNSIGYEFTEPEHDYIQILKDLAHVQVLTICDGPLMHITMSAEEKYYTWEDLPITFDNLQELQLLMTSIGDQNLSFLYGFFRNCFFHSLEKLFIEVPAIETYESFYPQKMPVKEPSDCSFDHLKLIKITGFKGHRNEMRLVKFLLEKAIQLEVLVLIVHEDSISEARLTQIPPLSSLRDQLVSMPRASLDSQIVLCEYSDDDNRLWPRHTEVFSKVCDVYKGVNFDTLC